MLGLCNDYESARRLPAGVVEDARLLLEAIDRRRSVQEAKARRAG